MSTHTVGAGEAGKTILDWLCARLGLSRPDARERLSGRQVRVNGAPCSNPGWRLRAGARVEVRGYNGSREGPAPPPQQSSSNQPRPVICFSDEHLVVVDKPAGLTTMRHADEAAEFGARARRYLPQTLADLLPGLLARRGQPSPIRAVHRLDRDTTGLVVFARTPEAERHLGRQFREHTVERLYLAVVRGKAVPGRIESWLVRDRGDGRRGTSATPGEGLHAVTHVRVVEELGPCMLVECRLETGRTHQVRIHLGEAGTPLCGERLYDRPRHGRPLPDVGGIARVALHAATLGLSHPATGERLSWSAPLPGDMTRLISGLQIAD